ncbi:MAG TPA: hypothetical protein VMT30_05800 [Candidatus Saccharimonadia bacterium]|nr:hypothetical protein [Candidatus Saccharimonadia bacterium]
MSLTFSPLTIAGCLEAAQPVTGRPLSESVNAMQNHLLGTLPPYVNELPFLEQFVQAFAALTAEEINNQLAAAGFSDLQLPAWEPGNSEFGMAGVLNVQIDWLSPATRRSLLVAGASYPAFQLKGSGQNCLVVPVAGGEPVVRVPGQNNLELRLQVVRSAPSSVFDLMEEGRRLVNFEIDPPVDSSYQGAVVPMVKLQEYPDVAWLEGLRTTSVGGEYWEVAQAAQRVRFGMNEYGARAMEVTTMGALLGGRSDDNYYEVDGPFLVTIHEPGMPVPIFAAYVTPNDWRSPGNLGAMTSW